MSEERARAQCTFPWGTMSFFELCIYQMGHIQHHAAQPNLILRQKTDSAPRWVGSTSYAMLSLMHLHNVARYA